MTRYDRMARYSALVLIPPVGERREQSQPPLLQSSDRKVSAPASISRRMAKGAAWMVLMRLSLRVIGLFSIFILARILSPEDFGLVALATSLVALLESLSEFSFDMALIRDQSATSRHYDTVWTLTVIRAVAIAASLSAGAKAAAHLFHDHRLEAVIYFVAVANLVSGFENVGIVDFRKELRFDREFYYALPSRLVAFVITLAASVVFKNYWALVTGILAGKLTSLCLSYVMHPYRPRPSLRATGDLLRFSKWMLLSSILLFLNNRLDTFFVGKLAGPQALGIYQVAQEISALAVTEIIMPVSRAIYPGYSKIAHDEPALRKAFLDTLAVVAALSLPAVLGVAVTADLVVGIFLGDRWLDAVPLVRILALYGAMRIGFANTYAVFLAKNRPDTSTLLLVPTVALLAALLYLTTPRFGAYGASWSLVASAALALGLNIHGAIRLLRLSLWSLLGVLWRPTQAACLMAIGVHLARSQWHDAIFTLQILELMSAAVFGCAVYIGASLIAWRLSGLPDGPERRIAALAKSCVLGARGHLAARLRASKV